MTIKTSQFHEIYFPNNKEHLDSVIYQVNRDGAGEMTCYTNPK